MPRDERSLRVIDIKVLIQIIFGDVDAGLIQDLLIHSHWDIKVHRQDQGIGKPRVQRLFCARGDLDIKSPLVNIIDHDTNDPALVF